MAQQLYQVFVTKVKDGQQIPFGPKMIRQHAENFIEAINKGIAKGKEKLISDPVLIKVTNLL